MGEARRRKAVIEKLKRLTCEIAPARFDLLLVGTRRSLTPYFVEEIGYWSDVQERLLGLVVRDRIDDDFGWICLARDLAGRFRCVEQDSSLASKSVATRRLRERIIRAIENNELDVLGTQGDEPKKPLDLLLVEPGTKPEELHPYFRSVIEAPWSAPTRAVISTMSPWFETSDPHFVKEFQRAQFDQRLWEMYLWLAFRELGFDVTQPEAPDFICSAPHGNLAVEATTVMPSERGPLADHPDPRTPEEMREFLGNYMPIKFGSSLTAKLKKSLPMAADTGSVVVRMIYRSSWR